MKEIKFRVWEKPGVLLQGKEHGTAVFEGAMHDIKDDWRFFGYCMQRPEEYEIMLFTGLLDKNGGAIYEGDVVKIQYREEQPPKYRPERYDEEIIVVKWANAKFSISPKYILNNEVYEILGNIYQNPELLTI